ncbi:hypothetical protein WME75_10735 [Sorangium sp. So ce1014]|uniref:hypothetical protein n=1 Tax=Sorangium sp. So ce1014 TaxID=3133326 RepID=UPI003F63A89C
MAFTSIEATKIRHYLGYPSLWRFQNPRLESAIMVVGGDPDATTIVQGLLTQIEAVRTQIQGTALAGAGLKALDKGDVELYPDNQQTQGMRSIGRSYVAELSSIFGVPINTDIFGTFGYQDDRWMMRNGRSSLTGLG